MDKFNAAFNNVFVPTISATLKHGIIGVWNAIAPDVDGIEDNECAVEVCIDANRLSTMGFEEAETELNALISEFNYTTVLKQLAKTVSLV